MEDNDWLEQFIDPTIQLYEVPEIIRMDEPRQPFTCDICKVPFTQKYSLNRHYKEQHNRTDTLTCPNCSKEFTRKQHLEIHEKVCNGGSSKRKHLSDCPELTPPAKKSRLIGQTLIDYEVCT